MVIVKKFWVAAMAVCVIVLGCGAPAYAAAEVTEAICNDIKNGTYNFTAGQSSAVNMWYRCTVNGWDAGSLPCIPTTSSPLTIFFGGAKCTGATDAGASDGDFNNIFTNIINTILYIVGFAAVAMIIIGGIMYTTSAGDEKRTTQGKKIVIGSLIGLAIAILAYVIVNFVIRVL
jgi:hypothetical protein